MMKAARISFLLSLLGFLAARAAPAPSFVSTSGELAAAIRRGSPHIVFTSQITGLEGEVPARANYLEPTRYTDFPTIPEECLMEDGFPACAADETYVKVTVPTTFEAADPGILWDVRSLRRRILVLNNVTVVNMEMQGVVSDAIPFTWFFMFANHAAFICENCTLPNGCYSHDLNYYVTTLQLVSTYFDVRVGGDYRSATGSVVYSLSQDTVEGTRPLEVFLNCLWICDESLLPDTPPDTTVVPENDCQQVGDKGLSYRGIVNVTETGHRCQEWEDQAPNFHTRLPRVYPEAGLVKNYCRNPDGMPRVWCYTTDGPRWEYCAVPVCSSDRNEGEVTDEKRSWGGVARDMLIIGALVAFVLVLIGALVLVWCVAARGARGLPPWWHSLPGVASSAAPQHDDPKCAIMGSARASTENASTATMYGTAPVDEYATDYTVAAEHPNTALRNAIESMNIQASHCELGKLIGKGGFGEVYRGRWRGLEVAIKTVTIQHDARRAMERVIAEAAITFSLSYHPNVVTTYHHELKPLDAPPGRASTDGSYTLQNPRQMQDWRLLLVQEYCEAGSLRKAIDLGWFRAAGAQTKLLMCVACMRDIARGMLYTHSQCVIHGDLTPSNVLLRLAKEPVAAAGSTSSFTDRPRAAQRGGAQTASRSTAASAVTDAHPYQAGWAVRGVPAAAALESRSGSLWLGDDSSKRPGTQQVNREPWIYQAKVGDYGLSVKVGPSQLYVSNSKQGTPFYVAPEVRDAGHLCLASDSYAFGVLMWEVFHSKKPFQVDRRGVFRKREGFPNYPRDCPLSYASVSSACLCPYAADRPNFAQIEGVLDDLCRHLQGCGDPSTAHTHRPMACLDETTDAMRSRSGDLSGGTGMAGVSTAAGEALDALSRILSQVDSMLTAVPTHISIGNVAEARPAAAALDDTMPSGSAIMPMARSFAADELVSTRLNVHDPDTGPSSSANAVATTAGQPAAARERADAPSSGSTTSRVSPRAEDDPLVGAAQPAPQRYIFERPQSAPQGGTDGPVKSTNGRAKSIGREPRRTPPPSKPTRHSKALSASAMRPTQPSSGRSVSRIPRRSGDRSVERAAQRAPRPAQPDQASNWS